MKNFKLYVITMPRDDISYEDMVEDACKGGADIIQFREKKLLPLEIINIAKKLKKICLKYKVPLIINDRVDIALASDSDGVHLGQDDVPVKVARKILGRKKIIGKSAHSIKQAILAEKEGVDYVSCGPIFSTPTKPDYPAVGLSLIKEYKKKIRIPFVAIGGIDITNIDDVLSAGAEMAAVVRAVCGSKDILNSCKELKRKLL